MWFCGLSPSNPTRLWGRELELTERMRLGNNQGNIALLHQLKGLAAVIGLENFGRIFIAALG